MKRLNFYCILLIIFSISMLIFNIGSRIGEYNNIRKGLYIDVLSPNWFTNKMILWSLDLNVLLISGIIFILLIRNINNRVVFDRKNIRRFRVIGFFLVIHFLLSTAIKYIDVNMLKVYGEEPLKIYTGSILDYPALIASLFILAIAEVFAIGFRLREEQELTI